MRTARHDPAQVRRILELREAEELTFQQVSERSGVPIHVLTYRASQDRLASRKEATNASAFIEVVAGTPENDVGQEANSAGIELHLGDGLRVRLDRHFDESALARLLSVLRC